MPDKSRKSIKETGKTWEETQGGYIHILFAGHEEIGLVGAESLFLLINHQIELQFRGISNQNV